MLQILKDCKEDLLEEFCFENVNKERPFKIEGNQLGFALKDKGGLKKLTLNYAYSKISKDSLIDLVSSIVCLTSLEELDLTLYCSDMDIEKMEILLTALQNCGQIKRLALNVA